VCCVKRLIPEFFLVCSASLAVLAPIEYFPLVKSADDGVIDSGPEFLRCCPELLEQSDRGEDFVIVKDFQVIMDCLKGPIDVVQRFVDRELRLLESRRRSKFILSH